MSIHNLTRTAFAMAIISSSGSQEWRPKPKGQLLPPATAAVPLWGLVPSNGRRPGRGFLHIAAVKSMEAVESPSLSPRGIRMRSFYELELKVRDYELDQFGVVNNAVYPRYCQHAFHELMERIALSVDEVARRGKALAIRESSMKFIAPLRSGDKFVVKVRFCSSTVTSLIVECILFKVQNQERVLESKTTVIWLDKSYRPVRIPSEMISKVLKFDTYNLLN